MECHDYTIKKSNYKSEIRYSEWLESMRKDVECTFGILKGRFRVLRYGVRLGGITKTDQLWKTCCALHNMLLDVDGLSERWENGVRSVWEDEVDKEVDLPFSLQLLMKPEKNATMI